MNMIDINLIKVFNDLYHLAGLIQFHWCNLAQRFQYKCIGGK